MLAAQVAISFHARCNIVRRTTYRIVPIKLFTLLGAVNIIHDHSPFFRLNKIRFNCLRLKPCSFIRS